MALALCHRRYAAFRGRLVVRRIAEREDAVPPADAASHAFIASGFGNQARAEFGLSEDGDALLNGSAAIV